MKILILGGSGFFGKSIVDYFQRNIFQEKNEIELILSSRNIHSIKNIVSTKYLNKKIFLEEIDVTTCKSIPNSELIIHAATSTTENDYKRNPEEEKKNIILGAENIMKIMNNRSSMIYVSSGAVYGKQKEINSGFIEDGNYKAQELEGTKLHYANAKIDAEKIILHYSKIRSIKTVIARCFAFVGKYLPRDTHFFIGNMIESILENNNQIIKAENKVYRSYMHADDLVRSLLFINNYAKINCEIFNIGSNEAIELHHLAEIFSKEYKFKISGNKNPNDFLKADIYVPNIDKLLSKGFKLNYNMIHSIKNVIKELKE
tara:strand:- start:21411 stop:22358 length:948 start_codon:yes stop_codon:yes gene_type:complete